MKKFVLFAALTSAIVLAAPAQSHPRPYAHSHSPGHATPFRADDIRADINRLDDDIDRADANDSISEREAADLHRRVADLRVQFHRMNANGLTIAEKNTLQSRANYIRERLRMERFDWDRHSG